MNPLMQEMLNQLRQQGVNPPQSGMVPRGPVPLDESARHLWLSPEEERFRVNEPYTKPANPYDEKLGRN